jgi:hypothetical protein
MTARPWFRMYREVLGDRKIARICKATGRPKALVLGVWTVILCLAGQSEQTGKLLISAHIPYTVEDIADETSLDIATVQAIVDEMIALQMLTREPEGTLVVTHWAERQFESDISTTRVNRHRQRREATSQEMDETATVAQASSGETFQETDETQSVAEAPLHETLQNQNQIQNQNRNRIRTETESESEQTTTYKQTQKQKQKRAKCA